MKNNTILFEEVIKKLYAGADIEETIFQRVTWPHSTPKEIHQDAQDLYDTLYTQSVIDIDSKRKNAILEGAMKFIEHTYGIKEPFDNKDISKDTSTTETPQPEEKKIPDDIWGIAIANGYFTKDKKPCEGKGRRELYVVAYSMGNRAKWTISKTVEYFCDKYEWPDFLSQISRIRKIKREDTKQKYINITNLFNADNLIKQVG